MERLRLKALIGRRDVRTRTLNEDKMQAVWEAAGKLGCPSGLVVRMLLTGQRLNEIAGLLSWGEIDLEQSLIAIPAARMKQSRAHEIPLCSDAKSLLQGLPRLTGAYVFSATGGTNVSLSSIAVSIKGSGTL
jgi:integrase